MKSDIGTVFWVTGLAGSGKTTFAKELHASLKLNYLNVVLLDGDALRQVFGDDLGYDRASRLKSAWRNARLCQMLSNQGIHVICATISLFHEIQNWNRHNIKSYCEIFIDTPLEEILHRNQKGLYTATQKTEVKNVVGVDIEPEYPKNPDFIINKNSDKLELTQRVLERLLDDKNKTW